MVLKSCVGSGFMRDTYHPCFINHKLSGDGRENISSNICQCLQNTNVELGR